MAGMEEEKLKIFNNFGIKFVHISKFWNESASSLIRIKERIRIVNNNADK